MTGRSCPRTVAPPTRSSTSRPGGRRTRAGRGPPGPGGARRRHRRRIAGRGDGPRRAARRRRRRRGHGSERARRGPGRGRRRAARPRLRLRLVDGDRAAADGAVAIPTTFLLDLAARERHRRLGRSSSSWSRSSGSASRSTTRCSSSCAGARSASAEHDERGRRAERDAARRLGRRLQRHDRGDLAARARRAAGAGPAQHRHRRDAHPAGQRRGRDHAAAGRPRHGRAEARLAAHPPRGPRRPRLDGVGAGRRAPPLGCGDRVHRRAGRSRRRRLSIQLGNPRADSLAQSGPARAGLEQARGRGHRHGPLSPFDALVRLGRSRARSPTTLAGVEGVRGAVAPADWRRDGTALVTVIPTEDGNSAGRPRDARPHPRRRRAGRGGDRRRGRAERRLPRRRLRQLPARHRADLRAHVRPARARLPLAGPAAEGRRAEPAVGRPPPGG